MVVVSNNIVIATGILLGTNCLVNTYWQLLAPHGLTTARTVP